MRSALLFLMAAATAAAADDPSPSPPNILWITCEDISPDLGCYGNPYAVTPNLDALAAQGVRYGRAFAPIGVCAPSRSSLILGMYAPSVGTHPMRCKGTLPADVKPFPWHLRRAGYYCTNNVKTDYNFAHDPATWDESSNKAHWRNRPSGRPFFAVFNFTSTHESQVWPDGTPGGKRQATLAPADRHDPAKAPLPPYHPDVPEVRADWARYADNITFMDRQVGDLLKQLDDDGLSERTIVFFFSDHGAGLPRGKRWLYDSSTRVPMIVRTPPAYAAWAPGPAGAATDRLVNFVDYGPTVLGLAGVPIPSTMQGVPFFGPAEGPPRRYVHGFRDRMDERYDLIRSVTDGRYRYIKNGLPHLPWFGHQYLSYAHKMPTLRVWQGLADAGELTGPAATFMAGSKPTEELYDTEADPWELTNLAGRPDHAATLARLRDELARWRAEIVDLGDLPEPDLLRRFGAEAPYAAVRRDPSLYPFREIARAADLAGRRDPAAVPDLVERLRHDDPAVRWWAATGLGALGDAGASAAKALGAALADDAPWVRVAAADALERIGRGGPASLDALAAGLADADPWVRLLAINALDRLDFRAAGLAGPIAAARADANEYVARVAEHATAGLDPAEGPPR